MRLRMLAMWCAALCAILAAAPAAAVNRVFNPGFADGMNGWEFQRAGGALAFPDSTSGSLCTSFSNPGLFEGDVLLLQRFLPVERDASYRLRFTASAAASRSLVAHVGRTTPPYSTYGSVFVNLTTVPQVYELVFTMTAESDPCAMVAFLLGGAGTAGVCIDDVLVEEVFPPPGSPPPPPPAVPDTGTEPLRYFADVIGLSVGSSIRPEPLFCEDDYAAVLEREYNRLTPELTLKFSALRPEPATFSFRIPDVIMVYAQQRGMTVHGHTLVWHEALPLWLTLGGFSPAQLRDILQVHVQTVVGRYAGQVDAWDVVNEAIDWDGSLRNTLWLQAMGPAYIDLAFGWARQADPNALLLYNDFGHEGLGAKSDGVYALVQGLVQRGVPIDGVGFQAHFSLDLPRPSREEIAANMDRYAALGLAVYVTEMDVAISEPATTQEFFAQAEVYRDLMAACVSRPNCHGLTTYGFTDKHSWLNEQRPGLGAALPFDAGFGPKPAYYALLRELLGSVRPVPALSAAGAILLVGAIALSAARRLSRS